MKPLKPTPTAPGAKPTTARSLQDLRQIQATLADAQAKAAAQAALRASAERRAMANQDLFVRAAGAVQRLPARNKAQLAPEQPEQNATTETVSH